MYKRKTVDRYILEGNYGYGWEYETEEESYRALKEQIKCYRENCPQYQYRAKIKRQKIETSIK